MHIIETEPNRYILSTNHGDEVLYIGSVPSAGFHHTFGYFKTRGADVEAYLASKRIDPFEGVALLDAEQIEELFK